MRISRRSAFMKFLFGSAAYITGWGRAPAFGQTAQYTYDTLGRVTTVTYSNGATLVYSYDTTGNRTSVVATPGAVQATFSANPGALSQGQSTSLSWTTVNATGVSIDNGIGAVSPIAGGSVLASPSATTTYTLTATGFNGPVTQQTTVTVNAVPTCTLSANPTSIPQGQSSTLSWTSTGATSASINNGVGSVTPVAGGSVSVSPGVTTTYTLTVTGPGGQATANATVTVNPPPTCSLSANPQSITQGQSTSLSWTSANATSTSIDNGVGSVTPVAGGSVNVSPSTTTTYTLTATGPGGQATANTTVNVSPAAWTQTIHIGGSAPVNLRTLANNAGYNGAQNANVTFVVDAGATVTGALGAPNAGIAIDTGTWPTGSYSIVLTLTVVSGGIVRGGGGAGGNGGDFGDGYPGGGGGDAIYCQVPINITFDSGSEARGGGGGGGGAALAVSGFPEPQSFGGGGGGGGAPNGPGGAGAFGDGGSGSPGSAGTTSGGGGGGVGGAGTGGQGGGYGATGQQGGSWFTPPMSGGLGGAAGYCVRKNGLTVNVTNNGSTSGTIG